MFADVGSVDQLSNVISHVIAPSFLLGAVAGFISILCGRLAGVLDRLRFLNALDEEKTRSSNLKQDIPRLRRRAAVINNAIFFAVASGVVATILIILAFAFALIRTNHIWVMAVLFMISLLMLFFSLLLFSYEVHIGLSEFDHHA